QIKWRVGGGKTVDRLANAVFVYSEVRRFQRRRDAIAGAIGHNRVNSNQVGVEPDRSYIGLFALFLFVLRLLRGELRDKCHQRQTQSQRGAENFFCSFSTALWLCGSVAKS